MRFKKEVMYLAVLLLLALSVHSFFVQPEITDYNVPPTTFQVFDDGSILWIDAYNNMASQGVNNPSISGTIMDVASNIPIGDGSIYAGGGSIASLERRSDLVQGRTTDGIPFYIQNPLFTQSQIDTLPDGSQQLVLTITGKDAAGLDVSNSILVTQPLSGPTQIFLLPETPTYNKITIGSSVFSPLDTFALPPITYSPYFKVHVCGDGIVNSPEQCDGNPDIIKDNGYCKQLLRCINCRWQAFVNTKNPQPEVCDGIDSDCNGIVDDYKITTCLNQEAYCSNQFGVCRGSTKTCGGTSGFLDCTTKNYNSTGKYQEIETLCDGLDNNCDGSVDEGCSCVQGSTRSCGFSNEGACKLGTQTCDDGKWGYCVSPVNPISNVETECDGVDNNCNGLVDECMTNRCGECGPLPQEVCNYRDDNCNAEPRKPTHAIWDYVHNYYYGFSDYCPNGTICKGVFADGKDTDNNGVADEGIDEGVKQNPNGNYTNWCNSCETQVRRCQQYKQEEFKGLHKDYYRNYQLNLKEATEKQIVQNSSGAFYFACQPDNLDQACCAESQCVYDGKCYNKGYRADIDNDGVDEICFSQSPGIWMEFGQNVCESDCTFFDGNIVHASCDGKNGCAFYDNVSRAVCDNSQPGWARDYNSTHYVTCAPGSPLPKTEISASVTCESGTLVKVVRIVTYNGKPIKLVVAICG